MPAVNCGITEDTIGPIALAPGEGSCPAFADPRSGPLSRGPCHHALDLGGDAGQAGGPKVRVKRPAFSPELCRACPRCAERVGDKRGRGPLITLHPDEERLQAARAFERTDYLREQHRQRIVVKHRVARLVQLGMRKSRLFGWASAVRNGVAAIQIIDPLTPADQLGLKVGDRLLTVNGQPFCQLDNDRFSALLENEDVLALELMRGDLRFAVEVPVAELP